ncbi:MAG: SMP-30/gluconolactonase/LRE family protein [Steroidobacteraceae bacterium]
MSDSFKPFARGDVFVGVTELDNPLDDHAGRGRIIQYDANLGQKGVLWLGATTHLVGGLNFDARGVLWAFDSHAFVVLNIHPDGRVQIRDELPTRAYSHVNFAQDGSFFLGEHLVGDTIRPEIAARMKTKLPFFPGGDRFGDGHLWRFAADGTLMHEYATQTHGGMGGFLGITGSALAPDGRTIVYCSETGPRLLRYDLANDRQLPDLQSFQPPFQGPPEMFFGMAYAPDGMLYVLRGARIDVVNDHGETVRSIALEGFGWATIALSADARHAYVGSFFTGEVARVSLASGAVVGKVQTGQARALAGIAVYAGRSRATGRKRRPAARQQKAGPKKKRAAKKKSAAKKKPAARRKVPARHKTAARRKPAPKKKVSRATRTRGRRRARR